MNCLRNILVACFSLTAITSASALAQDFDRIDLIINFAGMPEPLSEGYETVNGLKMNYQVYGLRSASLVLRHDSLMTQESIYPLLSELAENRTVHALALEGHGRTHDLDRPFSLDQFTADVVDFIAQLGLGPVDVIGFSMGGAIALELAAHHAEMVDRVAVISAAHQPEMKGKM